MKVRAVILARAALLADVRTSIYFPELISAVAERYGFVQSPKTPQEILSPDGVLTFKHGRIVPLKTKPIVIDVLTIHRQAIMAQVSTDTTDADYVLTDLVEWYAGTVDRRLRDELSPVQPRIYVSHLEIGLDASLNKLIAPLAGATRMLNETIAKYARTNYDSESPPPMEAQSVILNIDPVTYSLPCDFRVERRLGALYEQNVYFSQAPLKTHDHLFVLNELEQGLKAD